MLIDLLEKLNTDIFKGNKILTLLRIITIVGSNAEEQRMWKNAKNTLKYESL